MATKSKSGGGSGGGCASFILAVLFLWALVFGVSWKGHHYDVHCSCAKGVEVE